MNDKQDKQEKPAPEKSLREQQVEARKAHMRKVNPPLPRVRVNPKDDDMRRLLKHPSTGVRFPAHGSVEWPLDQFTRRRLKDGSVTKDERAERRDERRAGRDEAQAQAPKPTPTPA